MDSVIYQGPSLLDGAPIVAIITGFANVSQNEKTGQMLQTWILRQDISPIEAIHSGADASICGDCKHRGTVEGGRNTGRSCYVAVHNAPFSVWKKYRRGGYPHAHDLTALGRGRAVRLGAYGDPAAAPTQVWECLTADASGWTGYTHQWQGCDPRLQALCMASVDSGAERTQAKAQGWRTFRVTAPIRDMRSGRATHSVRDLSRGEATCPASEEIGKKLNCATCLACHGTAKGWRGDVKIAAHGNVVVQRNAARNIG